MILITGASGNVGSEVLKQAIAAGLKLRAAFQSPDKAAKAPAGAEAVIMDYAKSETIRPALRGVEKVFLVGPPTRDLPALEANVINAAGKAGVKHIVKLSALGGRESTFPRGHTESEDNVKASSVPYTFLRPNGFMQNFVIYNAGTINSQNAFYGVQGNGAVSHIDLRDIAAVAVKVLSGNGHESKAYPLTGSEALTNEQIAEKISRVAGRDINYVDLAPAELKKAMISAGVPEWSADALLDLQRLYREGKASKIENTVEQLIGRKSITFDQFVRDYASAFQTEARVAS